MTTIEIKTLSNSARKPTKVSGSREYFQLYAAGNYEFAPGKTKTVDAAIQVRLPNGYDLDVIDDELSMSRGLMINRYPGLGESTPFIDGDIPRLSYMVHNTSPITVKIHTGDELGRFRLLRVATKVDIQEVADFVEKTDDPKFKSIVDIPKTEASYFKRMYRENRDQCIDMFMTNDEGESILNRIPEFKKSADYMESPNKSLAEAYWVWKELSSESQEAVKNSFIKHKNEMTIKSRT